MRFVGRVDALVRKQAHQSQQLLRIETKLELDPLPHDED
jgi:hypothetical protein